MRLIDADALKKAMDGYWGTCQRIRKPRNGETAVFLDVRATVEKQPIIDAVPVRHGKWIDIDEQSYTWKIRCSCCGHERSMLSTQGEYPKYCEGCGARMEAYEEEEYEEEE